MDHGHRRQPRHLPALLERLRGDARKLTGPRQAILRVLDGHGHPMTAREIHAALPAAECDLATVYRSMHLLQGLRLVKRYDFGDGAARFELLGDGDDGHHHHLVCTRCASVVEIEGCEMEGIDRAVANRNGFQSVTHKLEFFGVCPDCQ